jgi:hypothetical protein
MHKSLFTQTDHATPLLTSTLWFYSAMLEMGISKSWPHALEQMTGSKEMSVAPIMEYFKPLREWLEKERCSKKYKIGWPGQPAVGVKSCVDSSTSAPPTDSATSATTSAPTDSATSAITPGHILWLTATAISLFQLLA